MSIVNSSILAEKFSALKKSVDSCFAKIKSHYEGIDMELLRTLKDNVKYDIAYDYACLWI